jgi:hypothetical protein
MTSFVAAALLLALGLPADDPARATAPVRTDPPGCLPTDVPFPVDATGPAPAAITVRFEIGDDGSATDISVAFPVDAVVSDMLVDAARWAVEICNWVPAEDGPSGAASRQVALRLPVVPARKNLEGLTPPRKVEVDCFRSAFNLGPLTIKKELKITAKFPIFIDGKPGRVQLLEKFDDPLIQSRLEQSITAAVKACEWIPGKDASGRPTAMYVILPIRLR